jgi:hypothetical protein
MSRPSSCEILRIQLARSPRSPEVVAFIDLRLFGQMSLNGCTLQPDHRGELVVVPCAGRDHRGKPLVHIHGFKLRAEITRKAREAYQTLIEVTDADDR